MRYLTYSGNNLIDVELPDDATVLYPPEAISGIPKRSIPQALREAVENPLGMPPLRELVGHDSTVLIAFDDNCQPFPPMQRPDIRQIMITRLLELLEDYGVRRENVQLRCAVALHRKMRRHEMEHMLGAKLMEEFWPERLRNFDAEDPDDIVSLHERLMDTLRGLERPGGMASAFFEGDARVGDIAWVTGYRLKSSLSAFNPHVTLGHGAEPPHIDPFEFDATTVAACHLGRFCSCRSVLRSWTLA